MRDFLPVPWRVLRYAGIRGGIIGVVCGIAVLLSTHNPGDFLVCLLFVPIMALLGWSDVAFQRHMQRLNRNQTRL